MASERRKAPIVDLRDVIAFVGLSMVGGGLYLVSLPAALIVPGALLFWLAVK